MTAPIRLNADSNLRRMATVALALALLFSLAQIVLAPPAPAASCVAGTNKCFRAQFGDIATSAADVPLTLTNVSSTLTTQQLGAVKITAPYAITSVKSGGVDLPVCPNPIDGSPTCRQGTLPATTIYIMNLNLAPNASKSLALGVNDPNCTTYNWAIEGRQSNKFQGSLNLTDLSTNSDLSTQVGGCAPPATPSFSVAFVDADADAAGVQRDAPDPVTGDGLVHYVAHVSNTGTGSGSATFTDTASNSGKIKILSGTGCSGVSGLNTGTATCTVTLGAGTSTDLSIAVQAPAYGANPANNTTNTASIASSSDNETTSIVPTVQSCGGHDCVTTYFEPCLGLSVSTGLANANNPFGISLTIPAACGGSGEVINISEVDDPDGCGTNPERRCSLGTSATGNGFEFHILPAACGVQLCTVSNSYETQILFQISPQFCQLTCVGFWESDPDVPGNNHQITACPSSDPKCGNGSTISGNTITFNIKASAGDGRTGYCAGTICI